MHHVKLDPERAVQAKDRNFNKSVTILIPILSIKKMRQSQNAYPTISFTRAQAVSQNAILPLKY